MVEPVTLTASIIANLAFQKCLEAGAGELGKKFTTEAIAKMDALRQKLWDRLRGRSPKLDEALDQVETGDRQALPMITRYLNVFPFRLAHLKIQRKTKLQSLFISPSLLVQNQVILAFLVAKKCQ